MVHLYGKSFQVPLGIGQVEFHGNLEASAVATNLPVTTDFLQKEKKKPLSFDKCPIQIFLP